MAPAYGQVKAGRPDRTYIQQLCEDTGCNPEDLPKAMNEREKWRERVRDIRAGDATWWWWWLYIHAFLWQPPTHNDLDILFYERQQRVNQWNSHVGCENRWHVKFRDFWKSFVSDLVIVRRSETTWISLQATPPPGKYVAMNFPSLIQECQFRSFYF